MTEFDQKIESNIEITYGIEDIPKPWWKSLYFAVQITLVDFTPFVWGGMFVSLAGLDAATVLPTMISACFLVMGICTLIQTTIGNRLPIVQGPSASLASSMGSVAATYGLPAVWGSVIVGYRLCSCQNCCTVDILRTGFQEPYLGAYRIPSCIGLEVPRW